ncbi:MAG: DsrE family protein [Gammaproteobacteria bacterium]|nr:DsrE family protein [Gammaproteobacteria bacterium]MBU1978470.1 DsrE family protein [Gammaproteobacteria bacterium]
MNWIKVFLLSTLLLQVILPTHAGEPSAKSVHKVIFQVSDNEPQKWYLTLSNVKNVQLALGMKNVQIEVLAYGPGLDMVLLETEIAEKIDEAVRRGVKIVACENTMIGRKLSREDMYPSVGYVKTGVVELMKRQREGWAYIRP